MTHAKYRAAAVLAAVTMAVALGGCQVLGIGGHGISRASVKAENTAIADFGKGQLEEGREALKGGRTADAISAFMLAKSFEEQAPAAYNGLAVAYSRIGRDDLTERFFQMAAALAPDDDRYRSNLALFYSRNGMTRSTGPALAFRSEPLVDASEPVVALNAIDVSAAPVARSLGAGISVRSPGSRLQRISSSELRITSDRKTAPSVAIASGHRPVIEVGRGSANRVPVRARVALVTSQSASVRGNIPSYPIRFPLDE